MPSRRALRLVLLFISTILFGAAHQHLHAQGVTTEEPPATDGQTKPAVEASPESQNGNPPSEQTGAQTPEIDLSKIPRATILPPDKAPEHAVLESDNPQSRHGEMGYASGNVVLTYQDHVLRADSLTYNHATDEVTVEGHVELTGGDNDEHIEASRGIYNLRTKTGRFYDVTGSVGLGAARQGTAPVTNAGIRDVTTARLPGYRNSNPFLFEGRMVVKTGPEAYTVYDGSVTSCLLPRPDWQIFSQKISLDDGKAKAANSTFRVLGLPLLFLPYVTHPVDSQQRQSGLLIPQFSYSSASKNTGSKGFTFGEQLYLTFGRSADLTVGTLYYSLRGFSENGTFRYRGLGDDFLVAHFSALQDRGFTNGEGVYTNQGGEDLTASFRRQFSPHIRAVGDAEYLSSYVYREVFTPAFNQAVSTDITSVLYLTHQSNGYSLDARFDRYEGLKVVPTTTTPGEEVRIFHAPSVDYIGLDHPLAGTPLVWSFTSSAAALKRVQPDFATAGLTERLDLRPELALPLAFAGWHTLSSVAVEETAYTRSRQTPYAAGATPVELNDPVNRAAVDVRVDIRPPAIERTFLVPPKWRGLLGDEVRHTIEPEITYRNAHGVNNFLSILRFDDKDLLSDTDELQYGVTQHLYFRAQPKKAAVKAGCPVAPVQVAAADADTADAADSSGTDETATHDADEESTTDANGIASVSATAPVSPLRTHPRHADPCAPDVSAPPQKEWFSWRLAQKHFFEPTFGGAVINGRRNIFDTTLDFSGIAFLTEPRNISPLLSRMRFRTSGHTDVEWDFDFDTGAKRFTSQNIFLDAHEGPIFGGFSFARLNAPGRTYSEVIDSSTNQATGLTTSAISDFSQIRFLIGYGAPTRAGLSAAASAGIDLNLGSAQYVTLQTSYNWNCCGLALEYRKYDLGTVRNEGTYSFNFTLANIGSAGNLRRAESLF